MSGKPHAKDVTVTDKTSYYADEGVYVCMFECVRVRVRVRVCMLYL